MCRLSHGVCNTWCETSCETLLDVPFVCVTQDTDLVASDIAAGLALLHQEQDKMELSRDPDAVVDHSPSSPIVSTELCRPRTYSRPKKQAGRHLHVAQVR